jgi:hypothetical protein
MQGHRVAVLEGEFLSGEILNRRENLLGWCSRRHLENHFVNEPRWLSPARPGHVGLTAILVQVKVPVFHEILTDAPAEQPLFVIGFKIKFASPPDVPEMLSNSREGVGGLGQYLHHTFWRAANRPSDLLDFGRRQVVAPTGSTPGKTE